MNKNLKKLNSRAIWSGALGYHRARDDTNANARSVSINARKVRLAGGIDLVLAIKQAHWNPKGSQFIGVHEMLDGFRIEFNEFNDKVAERALQLGATAFGSTQAMAERTKLNPPTPPASMPSPTTLSR
ncbi:Ferritin-like domain-containing protein [Methylobacterium sp. UNCCL125]|jgi:starvation-inducible DNA-binding protein|nr:Ferritin-like domain-containing protein [Methylobacterium sp. UNCCL125]